MIPRHQTILFVVLLVASITLGAVLWTTLDRAHKRLLASEESAPTQAPQVAPSEQATLMVANDADNSVAPRVFSLPLPQNPEARARAVLGKLLDLYCAPGSGHPVPDGASSVSQVFLLPVTAVSASSTAGAGRAATGSSRAAGGNSAGGDELAVVNLAGAFVSGHPSGLETETLTILSICATLHANFPNVTEVRFLVDGQQRATLAGHADLTRTYLTSETVPTEGAHS
ncbi:Lipoprotein LpqB, GerMN domain protein [Candidatus Sulfotelmatomonas gaucii]|uniref:Lipoprotein LpqB, GerMN domain protein n=1 Tax=Candidatus Sulfuritelmatomonas gaucii TaxID=2043161 RepID=A0A2N9LCJ3_9BACT|nr:Lipoprotein LpqB, GerMN domain protein [Candidatus Sulfotelmatomonas gaucii]